MRAAFLLAAGACTVSAQEAGTGWKLAGELGEPDLARHFALFKARFGKSYSDDEEARRFAVFKDNMAWVAANAADTHGVTEFADQTPDEFRASHLRTLTAEEEAEEAEARASRPVWDGTSCDACRRFPEMGGYREDTLDWYKKGAVTKVKNQGQCDSCYAFGATGDMEGSWFLAGNPLASLSEQEIISCVGLYNGTKKGCGGGTRAKMFKWVIDNGGITSEANYPYTSGAGVIVGTPKCKPEKEKPVIANFDSYAQVSNGAEDEAKIFAAVNALGPISIGISAVRMELYVGGIMDPAWCAGKNDHAPLIVGYGTANGNDYWKIKNSWGAGWGEAGFLRAARMKNVCGLASDAVHAMVGTGKRYHCHLETKTCAEADKGHSTMKQCTAACNAEPTPAPPPAPPAPPGPPAPVGPRYHCNNNTYQCITGTKGHSTIEQCETACFAPGYICATHPDGTPLCKGVATGGTKLHVCHDQCGTPAPPPPTPPPVPVTPAPCSQEASCAAMCKCKGKTTCVLCSGFKNCLICN